jgi:hypothetical protein
LLIEQAFKKGRQPPVRVLSYHDLTTSPAPGAALANLPHMACRASVELID